jgi:HEAT repeat protein
MRQLVDDPNVRIRLVAAGVLLTADASNVEASAALVDALADPTPRVRKAALELIDSLGSEGAAFVENLQQRSGCEEEAELQEALSRLVERHRNQVGTGQKPVAG